MKTHKGLCKLSLKPMAPLLLILMLSIPLSSYAITAYEYTYTGTALQDIIGTINPIPGWSSTDYFTIKFESPVELSGVVDVDYYTLSFGNSVLLKSTILNPTISGPIHFKSFDIITGKPLTWSFIGSTPSLSPGYITISSTSSGHDTLEYLSGSGFGLATSRSNGLWSDPVAVPVPASVFLLGSGILGLIGIRRKINLGN